MKRLKKLIMCCTSLMTIPGYSASTETAYTFTGVLYESFDAMTGSAAPGEWTVIVRKSDVSDTLTRVDESVWGGVSTAYNASSRNFPEDRHLSIYKSASGETSHLTARFQHAQDAPLKAITLYYDLEAAWTRFVDKPRYAEWNLSFSTDGKTWHAMGKDFAGRVSDEHAPHAAQWLTREEAADAKLTLRHIGGDYTLPEAVQKGEDFYIRWTPKRGGKDRNINLGVDNVHLSVPPEPGVRPEVKLTVLHEFAPPQTYIVPYGTIVTNITKPSWSVPGTQSVTAGWTQIGNEPAQGTEERFVALMTNDAVLTWHRDTQVLLTVSPSTHGDVTPAETFIWVSQGEPFTLTATPHDGYQFDRWDGNFPVQPEPPTSPTLTLVMKRAMKVEALFTEAVATSPMGVPIEWLIKHGLTNDPPDIVDFQDTDNDGAPTWVEYTMDTDPNDPDSVLRITEIVPTETGYTIEWRGGQEAFQVLERCSNLCVGQWEDIHTAAPPTAIVGSYFDPNPDETDHYRVRAYRQTP